MFSRTLPASARIRLPAVALGGSKLPIHTVSRPISSQVWNTGSNFSLRNNCCNVDATMRSGATRSSFLVLSLPFARSISMRAQLYKGFQKLGGGVYSSGGLHCRSFCAEPVERQWSEGNEIAGGGDSAEGVSSPSVGVKEAVQPSPIQTSQSADGLRTQSVRPLPLPMSQPAESLRTQSVQPLPVRTSQIILDLRTLIATKKRELAVLESSLQIVEASLRDQRLQDTVQKQGLGPDLVKPRSLTDSLVQKDNNDPERAKQVDGERDIQSGTAGPPSPKQDPPTMFGKLNLADFPPPPDPNMERLQRKRRRQELMKENLRQQKLAQLNFGVAGRPPNLGSNSGAKTAVDPLRPNAGAFAEEQGEKQFKSLADRLYFEQFGRHAPPGLKRTYPPGSFYDRALKEKERKDKERKEREEREAAAAAAGAPSSSSMLPEMKDLGASVDPIRDEASAKLNTAERKPDVSLSRPDSPNGGPRSNDIKPERRPAPWRCPECQFFNLATDKNCHKCQAEQP